MLLFYCIKHWASLIWILEYANRVWSPYKQCLIEEVENVQKRATKLVHECKHYAERLQYLKLTTLKYRRHRGDMIESLKHKMTHGLYDTAVVPNLMMSQVSHTRGNMYKLQKMYSSMIHVLENIFFTERVINLWKSLPSLVVEAPSLNCF